MKYLKRILIMLILVTIIGSCRNQRFSDTEKIVKEWIGREIILPSSIQEISRVQDTCKYINAPYKIFVYRFYRMY